MAKSKKKVKVLKWVAIAIVIIAVIYFLTRNNSTVAQTPASTSGGGSTPSPSPNTIDRDKVLKLGSRGEEVKILQRKLNRDGIAYIDPDTNFQTTQKLVVDGNFGRRTLAALKGRASVTSVTLNEIAA